MAGQLANGADVTYGQADSVFLAYRAYSRGRKANPKTKAALSLWFDAVLSELKARRRSGVFAHTLPLGLFRGGEFFDVVSECLKLLPEEERVSYVVGKDGFIKAVSGEAKKVTSAAGCSVKALVEKKDARESYEPFIGALSFPRAGALKRLEALREYWEVSHGRNDDFLCGFDLWCKVTEEKDPSIVDRTIQQLNFLNVQRNFLNVDAVLTCVAVIEYLDRKGISVLRACCRHLNGDESRDTLLAPCVPVMPELPEVKAKDLFDLAEPDRVIGYVKSGRVERDIPVSVRRNPRRSKGAPREPKEVSALDAMVSAVHFYVKIREDREKEAEDPNADWLEITR
jgi:hypothetical protein